MAGRWLYSILTDCEIVWQRVYLFPLAATVCCGIKPNVVVFGHIELWQPKAANFVHGQLTMANWPSTYWPTCQPFLLMVINFFNTTNHRSQPTTIDWHWAATLRPWDNWLQPMSFARCFTHIDFEQCCGI